MITYPPGTPSWTDVAVPDVDAGIAFYTGLFGWSAEPVSEGPEETGNYHMFRLDGKQVAGIGMAMQGMPSVWNTYIAVDDVAVVQSRVDAAGGSTVIPAFDVFTAGTMAVFTDPAGAFFCVWKAGDNTGAEYVNAVGAYAMAELDTRDRAAVEPFYSDVFGWTFEPIEVGGTVVYESVKLDGRLIAGLFPIGDQFPPDVPNHWRPYFGVEDVEAAMARVSELGGQVLNGPTEVPGGRFATLLDPFGASFSVLEAAEYDPPPGA